MTELLDDLIDFFEARNTGNAMNKFLNRCKEEKKKQLLMHSVNKRLSIKLEDWHYQCGDGCCDMYGTEIVLNGKKCDNQYAGDDVRTALEFVLTKLGYEVDIDVC